MRLNIHVKTYRLIAFGAFGRKSRINIVERGTEAQSALQGVE